MTKLTVAFRNFANAPKKDIINTNVKSAVSRKCQWTNIKVVTTVDRRKTIYTNA